MRKIIQQYWLKDREFPIDLTLSENPLGPPKIVKKMIDFDVSRYPKAEKLVEAISVHFCIPKENIIVGAGINEFINLIPQAILKKGDLVLIPKVTFPRFEEAVRLFGGRPIFVPMGKDLRINFEVLKRKAQKGAKLIFIANPNNPTGLVEDKIKIIELTKKTKAIPVCDEAGIDFVGEEKSLIRETSRIKNLIVLRGFSKGWGLAGLRIGFCVAQPEIIKKIRPIQLTFSVSSVAIETAILALEDKTHLRKTRKFFKKEKRFLSENLKKLGFEVIPSETNYILAKVNPIFSSAEDFIKAIAKKGANCVDGKNFHLPKFIRISPKDHKTNEKFIEIVTKTIQEKQSK